MKKKLLGLLVIGIFCFAVASWIMADLLVAPVSSKAVWPAELTLEPKEVSFAATDGVVLKGWFLSQAHSTGTIVLLHGVRANRAQMLDRALWLHSLGYQVLLYDARGCGESSPALRSFGYYETRDLLGALAWLQQQGINDLACVGCSQGAATILLASGGLPPAVKAIVAEAPYATLRNTVDDHFRMHTGLPSAYLGAWIVPLSEWKLGLDVDEVSPLREIAKLKIPMYLIGGTSDVLAPPRGIHELYDADASEKNLWMIDWAGHTDFFAYAEADYKQRIGDFLRKHL